MATLNRNYVSRTGTLIESFDVREDFQDYPSAPDQVKRVYDDIKEGSGALKVVSLNSSNNQQALKTVSLDLSNIYTFHFWVYVTADTTINIGFTLDANFSTNYFNASLSTNTLRAGYWNLVRLDRSDFTTTGTIAWTDTMQRFRVRVVSGSATDESYAIFDDLRGNMLQRPKILVNFDSAVENTYTKCFPIMSALNIPGTLYTQSGLINGTSEGVGTTSAGMTVAELQDLYAHGWDIGSHSRTHPSFTSITLEQVDDECNHPQRLLLNNHMERAARHFAYPTGTTSDAVIGEVAKYYDTARVTTNTPSPMPLADPYRIECLTMKAVDPVSKATDFIDLCISDGKLGMLMFESVADSSPTAQEVLTADFKTIMEYIARRSSQIDAVTMTGFLRGLTSPRKRIT